MDINLLVGTIFIPVAIACLNFLVRLWGKLAISPSSDLLLVLLCLDITNLISMDFFKKVVQSELVRGNLSPIVGVLMICTLAAWLTNILAVEKGYEARQAIKEKKDRYFVGSFDCKKFLLLGVSFVLSVVIFGLHIGTIIYNGVEG
ncbi:hypothetical protein MC64_007080 [Aeromonas caviae]|nr:hypothetical protein MC64_007080 [Aeromonas caviae]